MALLVSLPVLAWATGSAAQEAPDRSLVTVRGIVFDAVTGQPLAGVLVVVAGSNVRLESDDAGRFTITQIPAGTYRLELSRPGYRTSLDDFTVLASGEFATFLEPIGYLADGLMTGIFGVVRDGIDGSPVVGATIRTLASPQPTQTDGRGPFQLDEAVSRPTSRRVLSSGVRDQGRLDWCRVREDEQRPRLALGRPRAAGSDRSQRRAARHRPGERRDSTTARPMGFGKFLDRDDIEKRPPGKMSDLFAGLAGVTLVRDPRSPGQRHVMLSAGRDRGCFPRVMLDDVMVGGGGWAEPAQLDVLLSRSALAGVEVYTRTAGIPSRWGGTLGACGVIVIWTRR